MPELIKDQKIGSQIKKGLNFIHKYLNKTSKLFLGIETFE